MSFFVDLFVSIFFVVFISNIAKLIRNFARKKWRKKYFWQQYFLEFVAAFEMTAVAYECSVAFGIGGVPLFGIFVFSIWYWRSKNWHDVFASPCPYVVQYWSTTQIGLPTLIFIIIAQLTGGFLSYNSFTTLYWGLDLTSAHTTRLDWGLEGCTTHIQVLPLLATYAEGFGIFSYIILAKLISRVKFLEGVPAGLLNAFIGTSFVLLALEISGGYFNPILASSTQFGCSGSTLWEHILVYWVASIIGTLAAHYIDEFFGLSITKAKDILIGQKSKKFRNKKVK